MLEVRDLSVKYNDRNIVNGISFTLLENKWLMIAGPNGAGKSTVVRAVSKAAPYTGDIFFAGMDIRRMKPDVFARNIGVISQNHTVSYSFTVGEIVRMGRYSHERGILGSHFCKDDDSVKKALEITGMLPFENQSALTLSGGELKRTFLAQIFAQEPRLLILDEPTSHLDLMYQKQIFELIGEWALKPGRAVISIVHDLSLARAYGDEIMLLNKGRAVALGKPETVLSRENLLNIYAIDVREWMLKMLGQWED